MGPCADDIEGCPTETQLCPCNCDWMQAYEGFQEVEGAGPRICDVRILLQCHMGETVVGGGECKSRSWMFVLLVPAVDGVVFLFFSILPAIHYNIVQWFF